MKVTAPKGRSYKHAKSAGKGSKPRPVNGEQYRKNFDAIFRKPAKPVAESLAQTMEAMSNPRSVIGKWAKRQSWKPSKHLGIKGFLK